MPALAVFDIAKAKDAHGTDSKPVYDVDPGTINHPKPFPCSITPRSESHRSGQTIEIDPPFEVGDSDNAANLDWRKINYS